MSISKKVCFDLPIFNLDERKSKYKPLVFLGRIHSKERLYIISFTGPLPHGLSYTIKTQVLDVLTWSFGQFFPVF